MKILLYLYALAGWTTIGLWLVADRALHGGVRSEHLLQALLLIVLGFAVSCFVESRRRHEGAATPVDVASVGMPLVAVIVGVLMAVCASLLELIARERPDGSTVAMLASLFVHCAAAGVFAATRAGESFQRVLARSSQA